MSRLNKIDTAWSSSLAYALGLITTDGNLSPDGRHIIFTSKDLELIHHFQNSLKINFKITKKSSGAEVIKKYYVVQFSNVNFYKFLQSLGLMPKKSKIMHQIIVPDQYFFDFLRGHFDGDGTFYSYWDPRWRSSYMFYTTFVSASQQHITWLQSKISNFLNINGHITKASNHSCYQLKYAKADSLQLLPKMYYNPQATCLTRKRLKIHKALAIIDQPF